MAPLPGLNMEMLARNMRSSPNSMLQGLEQRFQARLAMAEGASPMTVLRLQNNALALLRQAQARVECGLLQLERAETLRTLGDTAEESSALRDAESLLSVLPGPARQEDGRDAYARENAFIERCYRQLSSLDYGDSIEHYASQIAYGVRELFQAEREGKVLIFAPDSTQGFSRVERDKVKIHALWQQGLDHARARMDEVRAYLRG